MERFSFLVLNLPDDGNQRLFPPVDDLPESTENDKRAEKREKQSSCLRRREHPANRPIVAVRQLKANLSMPKSDFDFSVKVSRRLRMMWSSFNLHSERLRSSFGLHSEVCRFTMACWIRAQSIQLRRIDLSLPSNVFSMPNDANRQVTFSCSPSNRSKLRSG